MGIATRAVPAGDVPSEPEGTAAAPEPTTSAGSARAWRPARVAIAVFLVGLAVTGALAWTSHAVYDRNESRLLNLRVRELGLVLTSAVEPDASLATKLGWEKPEASPTASLTGPKW